MPPVTLALFIHLSPDAAWAADRSDAAAISTWVRGQATIPAAISVMTGFSTRAGGLSAEDAEAFARQIRANLAREVAVALEGAVSACEDRGQVSFLDAGTVTKTEVGLDFEASLFHVESLNCLETSDLQGAWKIYQSPVFRLDVMPALEGYQVKGDQQCLRTGGILGIVDPTGFCMQTAELARDGFIVEYGRLVSNDPDPTLSPVWFRESLTAFLALPGGGVAVWRGVWTRARDLGGLQRAMLRTVASGSQDKVMEALKDRLEGSG